jgi:hypothetical protein
MAIMASVSIGDRVIVDIIDNVGVILDNQSGNDNPFSNDCMQITSLYQSSNNTSDITASNYIRILMV